MGVVPSVRNSRPRFHKTLLVCAESCDAVEKCLTGAGCVVTRVCDGDRAVNRMRREIFDTAVVVSTGQEMDMAETVFNLRDIRSSMEIVIVAGCADANQDVIGEIAATVPKVSMFTITEFQSHLDSIAGREK
jgi:CheY-like chemotaxis protein